MLGVPKYLSLTRTVMSTVSVSDTLTASISVQSEPEGSEDSVRVRTKISSKMQVFCIEYVGHVVPRYFRGTLCARSMVFNRTHYDYSTVNLCAI